MTSAVKCGARARTARGVGFSPHVLVPCLRDAALAAPLARRVLRGREAEIARELARVIEPCEVPQFGQQDNLAEVILSGLWGGVLAV